VHKEYKDVYLLGNEESIHGHICLNSYENNFYCDSSFLLCTNVNFVHWLSNVIPVIVLKQCYMMSIAILDFFNC